MCHDAFKEVKEDERDEIQEEARARNIGRGRSIREAVGSERSFYLWKRKSRENKIPLTKIVFLFSDFWSHSCIRWLRRFLSA